MRFTLTVVLFVAGSFDAAAQGVLHDHHGAPGDLLGNDVGAAGDVDNDGFADVVAGSPAADPNGASSGRVTVFSGATGGVLHSFGGDSPGDQLGSSVDGAGDVNNDGYADVIAGAPFDDDGAIEGGAARVFCGQTGAILYTFFGDGSSDFLGTSVAGGGDVDNDGFADLVVGVPLDDDSGLNAGSARVFSGQTGAVLHQFNGDGAEDGLGTTVAGGGDVDQDGYADVIAGAPLDDDQGSASGSVRVYSGFSGAVLHTFFGDGPGDWFGWSSSRAGDVDQDGFDDVIAGALFDDDNGVDSGSCRVFSGASGSTLFTRFGDASDAQLGWAVGDGGDVDGDGFADVIAGAHKDAENGFDSGAIHVFLGPSGAAHYKVRGEATADRFGRSVDGAGDGNGDGYDDVIGGAYRADANGIDSGRAKVIGGTSCGGMATPYGVGCGGSGGLVPQLAVDGCIAQGGVGRFEVTNALGAALGFIFVGLNSSTNVVAGGCVAHVFPILYVTPIVTSGSGPGNGTFEAVFGLPFPALDVIVRTQVYVADPGSPVGFSNTNAVTVDIHR